MMTKKTMNLGGLVQVTIHNGLQVVQGSKCVFNKRIIKVALQGSETEARELLGGKEENSVSPMRGH